MKPAKTLKEAIMSTIGVILAGCGNIDGAEIHESVLTLLYLARAGVKTRIYAPDVPFEAVNFLTGKPMGEKRGVLMEAARIARGDIKDVARQGRWDLDALILPGRQRRGQEPVANFATRGPDGKAPPRSPGSSARSTTRASPWGPSASTGVLAWCSGPKSPALTIGNDMGTAKALEKTGAVHVDCPVDGIVVDEKLNLVTTPAYIARPRHRRRGQGHREMLVAEIVRRPSAREIRGEMPPAAKGRSPLDSSQHPKKYACIF
jgi:enhancing lycopene biosynthesis protein 2